MKCGIAEKEHDTRMTYTSMVINTLLANAMLNQIRKEHDIWIQEIYKISMLGHIKLIIKIRN